MTARWLSIPWTVTSTIILGQMHSAHIVDHISRASTRRCARRYGPACVASIALSVPNRLWRARRKNKRWEDTSIPPVYDHEQNLVSRPHKICPTAKGFCLKTNVESTRTAYLLEGKTNLICPHHAEPRNALTCSYNISATPRAFLLQPNQENASLRCIKVEYDPLPLKVVCPSAIKLQVVVARRD